MYVRIGVRMQRKYGPLFSRHRVCIRVDVWLSTDFFNLLITDVYGYLVSYDLRSITDVPHISHVCREYQLAMEIASLSTY